MTEHRPPACHFDRALGRRVTREHRDDCPKGNDCPGDHGCKPCTAPHCVVCGRTHATNATPITCPSCQGVVDQDLLDIRAAYAALATEALEAGADGRLVAAAPIPGGTAAVMIGPTVRLDMLRTYPGYSQENFRKDHGLRKNHRTGDPLPPLAVLAQWEDLYRTWLGHTPTRRATIGRAIGYLRDQLPYIAQATEGPDWVEFTRQVRRLRAACEHALHDEREPEQGVECFECGDQLVRRFRTPSRCDCAPRPVLQHAEHGRCDCVTESRIESSTTPAGEPGTPVTIAIWGRDPDDGHIHERPDLACIACHREREWEGIHAEHQQGGLDDPRSSMSWECPGCRKEYSSGEYHTAVRRDLLDNTDAWTTIANAVGAAKTLTRREFNDRMIRGWVARGWVESKFDTRPSGLPGARLVKWPDVKREALRIAAGLYHCKHATPARVWLKVLESYPEIPVWEDELEAGKDLCEKCESAVLAVQRHVRGTGVA